MGKYQLGVGGTLVPTPINPIAPTPVKASNTGNPVPTNSIQKFFFQPEGRTISFILLLILGAYLLSKLG